MQKISLQEFYLKLKINQPVLGIDYGKKKIGISISSPDHSFAMPFLIIENNKDIFSEIIKIINTKNVSGIVIGVPYNMDGSISENSKNIFNFSNVLLKKIDIPAYFQDERLTSKAADNLLKLTGMKRKERNKIDDSIAASMILESVLSNISHLKK